MDGFEKLENDKKYKVIQHIHLINRVGEFIEKNGYLLDDKDKIKLDNVVSKYTNKILKHCNLKYAYQITELEQYIIDDYGYSADREYK